MDRSDQLRKGRKKPIRGTPKTVPILLKTPTIYLSLQQKNLQNNITNAQICS